MVSSRACVVLGLIVAGSPGIAVAADSAPGREIGLKLHYRGAIELPESVGVDQERVSLTGLSGITWLGDDRYLAVMDNSAHLLRLRIALSPEGTPLAATDLEVVAVAERHDYEDLAPRPGGPAAVFLCEEDTPAIRAFRLADGAAAGTIPLPETFTSRRGNRGPEALALDPDWKSLWTANEEALACDGPAASARAGTVVRITRLPLPRGRPATQAAYLVDPVHEFLPVLPHPPLSGLVALVALGRGRLLVLERSAGPGLPPFTNRIYYVDTTDTVDVSGIAGGLADRSETHLEKTLLWADRLGLNIEGLCVGPKLASGRRALVAISDNGGLETPTRVAGFVLSATLTSP